MTAKSRLVGAGIHAYLSSPRAARTLHGARRLLGGGRRRVTFYYRADDPYSDLLAQLTPRLAASFDLEIRVVPVGIPSLAANPAPEMLAHHAMRDAHLLAEAHGLRFPSRDTLPPPDRIRRAHAVLLRSRPMAEQLDVVARVGEAVWNDDGVALGALVATHGAVAGETVDPLLERNYARLERAGHYQPGMLHYGGEWYWGVDRLPHLIARLRDEGASGDFSLPTEPAPSLRAMLGHADGKPKLRVFFSFRSPYSYVALPQIQGLRDEGLVDVEVAPVLPMVMRGLPVSIAKRLYIVRDVKREADRLGIPFGRLCDPLGNGIAHCFAVFYACAVPKGIELEFALSVMRGTWSEARDVASLTDLIFLSERVGITEAEVRRAIGESDWRARADANRDALTDLGLWGVPSLQIGSYSTWGQDRLGLIRAALGAS